MDLDVLCSDFFASGDDPAKESSDVGSDVCVVSDSMPTVVSVWTVVTEEWMDRFVMDLVECLSVSRTSAVARAFGPAVSEEYSPVVLRVTHRYSESCCVPMETRHKNCCLIQPFVNAGCRESFHLQSWHAVHGLLFLSTRTRWLPV